MLGEDQPVILHLIDIPQAQESLKVRLHHANFNSVLPQGCLDGAVRLRFPNPRGRGLHLKRFSGIQGRELRAVGGS